MSIESTTCGLGISDVSAIIPNDGRRASELDAIIAHLTSIGFKDIIIATGNKKMMNRYDAVSRAKNDIIYTQDDDLIVNNIYELLNQYEPGVIVCNAKRERIDYYEKLCRGKIALVGYGSLFHKDLVRNIDKYTSKYGEDDVSNREADRIFTWLNDKKLVVADSSISDFPSAAGGMSYEADHYTSMFIIMDRLSQIK